MKDYDGPAFYRENAVTGEKKENGSRDAVPHSRYFHPTYIPDVIGPRNAVREPDYRRLIAELVKDPDDYLLFTEECDDAVDLTEGWTEEDETGLNGSHSPAEDELEEDREAAVEEHAAPKSQPTVTFYPRIPVSGVEAPVREDEDRQAAADESAEEADETDAAVPAEETVEAEEVAADESAEEADETDAAVLAEETVEAEEAAADESAEEADDTDENMQLKEAEENLVPAFDEKGYRLPPLSLLPSPVSASDPQLDEWVLSQADTLNETLKAFKVEAEVTNWTVGPTVTQFELSLGRGVKVNKITNLNDDLKLALAARDIRIEAPIPGRSTVGIEIPNRKSRPVLLSEVLGSQEFRDASSPLTTALGVDLFGHARVTDIRKMPHGLIAGATGSGKSVFINSLLMSILYKAKPSEVKLLLIDPKAVEMAPYQGLPHLLSPVVSDPQAATEALKWAVEEMEERYQKLAAFGARNIEGYNRKLEEEGHHAGRLSYIVIVIDELADLMMASSSEVQEYIARITQKARAAGIHLIVATQRPSVDVVTGLIKNNIPTRIAFMVASSTDSRTILDCSGAERLLGRGDMLYLGNGSSQPLRLQGTYIEDEIDDVCDFIRSQAGPHYAFNPESLKRRAKAAESQDELMPRVLDYIVNEETVSTSKLQRVFSIGYNRAASIIDDLEGRGYVSPARGAKPRTVHLTQEALNNMRF